ncbi:hypothetical protein BJV78DRAFT_1153255 [Lactifluus subvellereus]|nr:hypothetical protein BJV78DRAFT_1153255 [Lactifluus subvellereus]
MSTAPAIVARSGHCPAFRCSRDLQGRGIRSLRISSDPPFGKFRSIRSPTPTSVLLTNAISLFAASSVMVPTTNGRHGRIDARRNKCENAVLFAERRASAFGTSAMCGSDILQSLASAYTYFLDGPGSRKETPVFNGRYRWRAMAT